MADPVPDPEAAHAAPLRLASWVRSSAPSAIQEMLALSSRPGLLSLALGLPAAELFPTAEYAAALARVLTDDARALQYEIPGARLKRQIVALMARRGVACTEAQVFLTAGSQQGMNLLGRLLLEQGSTVVVEERAYPGFLQMIAPYAPRILTVPSDLETGMDVDAVAALLSRGERPTLLYAIADGHNPLGVSLDLEKRRRLVDLASAYQVPIIEDDPYGFLSYGAQPLPPLRAFGDRWVLYVGSFSKLLAPAVRAGWLIVPEELCGPLSVIKESSDINTATLTQRGVCEYLAGGALEARLPALQREYGARRDAMLGALGRHFSGRACWTSPSAGMFVWVELPPGADTLRLLSWSVESEGVAFLPGPAFSVPGGPSLSGGMRLNFSNCDARRIEEGVRRLSRALETLRP